MIGGLDIVLTEAEIELERARKEYKLAWIEERKLNDE